MKLNYHHLSQNYSWTCAFFLQLLALLYLIAFLPLFYQYQGLLGESGLAPITFLMSKLESHWSSNTFFEKFFQYPTLFWLGSSNLFFSIIWTIAIMLALLATVGIFHPIIFAFLWLFQLSLTNCGQLFYSFGWESNLCEIGFLAIFIPPITHLTRPGYFSSQWNKLAPLAGSYFCIFLLRLALFRLMFGAGLIKIRYDECWQNLTCMNYHFETQPIPGPLSFIFHSLPDFFKKAMVLFNHIVEIVLPFLIFMPGPFRNAAGIIFWVFQWAIIITGNFAWINYLTLTMIVVCFDDIFLRCTPLFKSSQPNLHQFELKTPTFFKHLFLFIFILILNKAPLENLIGPNQVMNRSYGPFHLVNSYGVFGSITKTRYEVIFKGQLEKDKDVWLEYEFPCKPGKLDLMPCMRAPYHYRITWQLWFAAMGSVQDSPWIFNLVYKLLSSNKDVLNLLEVNPFGEKSPYAIKADLYLYEIGDRLWYKRSFIKEFFPALTLQNFKRQ